MARFIGVSRRVFIKSRRCRYVRNKTGKEKEGPIEAWGGEAARVYVRVCLGETDQTGRAASRSRTRKNEKARGRAERFVNERTICKKATNCAR